VFRQVRTGWGAFGIMLESLAELWPRDSRTSASS
jgi:hypothetical protein